MTRWSRIRGHGRQLQEVAPLQTPCTPRHSQAHLRLSILQVRHSLVVILIFYIIHLEATTGAA
jgi:hypothetical protein